MSRSSEMMVPNSWLLLLSSMLSTIANNLKSGQRDHQCLPVAFTSWGQVSVRIYLLLRSASEIPPPASSFHQEMLQIIRTQNTIFQEFQQSCQSILGRLSKNPTNVSIIAHSSFCSEREDLQNQSKKIREQENQRARTCTGGLGRPMGAGARK